MPGTGDYTGYAASGDALEDGSDEEAAAATASSAKAPVGPIVPGAEAVAGKLVGSVLVLTKLSYHRPCYTCELS